MLIKCLVVNEMKKHLLYRYTVLIVSLFCSAIVFNLFLYPTHLVTGGLNGVVIVINYFWNISPSILLFVCSAFLLILSFVILKKEQTVASLLATFLYPFFVEITSSLPQYLTIDTTDFILMSILVGILLGITNGFMYKVGFSNGGLNILSLIFHRYFHLSLGKSTLVLNSIVVVLGGLSFGFSMVLYSLVVIFISSMIMDRIILGVSRNKAFYILTTKEEKVRKYIIETLHHSVTIFKVKGAFLEKKQDMLLAVIPSREYFQVTEGIKMIDPQAFFVACDAYEVKGGR